MAMAGNLITTASHVGNPRDIGIEEMKKTQGRLLSTLRIRHAGDLKSLPQNNGQHIVRLVSKELIECIDTLAASRTAGDGSAAASGPSRWRFILEHIPLVAYEFGLRCFENSNFRLSVHDRMSGIPPNLEKIGARNKKKAPGSYEVGTYRRSPAGFTFDCL
jgi:hypothetical protein